ncbi:Response regulator inhibitor for tor operon [Klebsiella pneumoniae]|nr:Response regulator inhibitor for tor operon [Klebsiella pneumoniae]
MKHEMQPDSLVDLKFIMADTGFGKTFIYDRIKSGDLPKAKLIHGRARCYIVTTASSEKSSCPAPMGKVTSKYFSHVKNIIHFNPLHIRLDVCRGHLF